MAETERLVAEAMNLTDEERATVALALLDSLEAPDPHAHLTDDELRTEIQRRAKEALGGAKGFSWSEVRSQIEAKREM